MKKLIAAVLLANLWTAAGASGLESLRSAGFGPITLEAIKARPVAANKGVSIVINNVNINNGSSSVHTNVSVNGINAGAQGNNGVGVAVNNTSVNNQASSVATNVNVHNAGLNSDGSDNINIAVNNDGAHNGLSSADTNINVHNADFGQSGDDNISVAVNNNNSGSAASSANTAVNINNTNNGAYSDGNIGVNITNTNNGVGSAASGTDVTVNGVNANSGKEAVYESPILYRYESQAQRAMEKVLNNLEKARDVQVLSRKITECGYSFNFEVRFLSKVPLSAYTPQRLFTSPAQAENLMYGKVQDLKDQGGRIVSADLITSGYSYTYVIAYFPAK